jgi:HD superfamily phosphohydrolase
VLDQYEQGPRHRVGGLLSENDRWQIATMIVGSDFNPERADASPGPERRYLRQLINGPFDVDKLDYVARDGYFTGLSLAIDIERLLWILDTIQLEADQNGRQPRIICVSASGATVLEQILFSKMQLYSSVYHHHKVRVAHQALFRLLSRLKEAGVPVRGLPLDDPATYTCLDDADILHACQNTDAARGEPDSLREARLLTNEIRERNLPMRALVLTHPVWGTDPQHASDRDRVTWELKMKAANQPDHFAAQVAHSAGLETSDVWVDIPGPAPLQGTAQEGIVKFDDHTYLAIVEIFPIGGWISGYDAYRTISYVFTRRNRERVGRAAREVLSSEYGITTNDVSLKLARSEGDVRA